MNTEVKLVQVPFDLEMAQKITSGDMPGKVVTRDGKDVRVLCFDKKYPDYPIVALVTRDDDVEVSASFTSEGNNSKGCSGKNDLMLEIPEYLTFKDGAVVTMGWENGEENCTWVTIIKKIELAENCVELETDSYVYLCLSASKGNDFGLVFGGISGAATWAVRSDSVDVQQLVMRLRQSEDPRAKEILKRFFNIEIPPKVSNSEEIGKKFEDLAKPMIDFLKENYHPHATVIIDCEHAELLEGSIGFSVKSEE